MKIYSEVLSEELLDLCRKDVVNKQKDNVWHPSGFFWQHNILKNIDGSCLTTPITDIKIINLLNQELYIAFNDYEYDELIYQYYVWESYSGISEHDDSHHNFGATIYLNSNLVEDGGLFVWQDEECPEHFYRCLNPQENMMVVNDGHYNHLVTHISPHAKQYRYTIQIWGKSN